jgi:AraC family L-rhamnose operon transcriptional activator RhaR
MTGGSDIMSTSFEISGSILWEEDLPLFINRGGHSFDIPIHIHDFIEIAYISEGRGIHYVGGDQIHVEPGDLFVIAIGTPHVFRPLSIDEDRSIVVYNCIFERNYINRFLNVLPDASAIEQLFHLDTYSYRYYKKQQNEVGSLVEKLYMEYTLRLPEYKFLLNTQMLYLISTLYRYESQGIKQSSTRNKLEHVFKYINSHYNESLKVEELAAIVPISVTHLQRLFKQIVGQTITEYVQSLRISKSCELLRNTAESIPEISKMVGYNDLTFFHALFKKKTGTTPYQYRKINEMRFTYPQ